MERETVLRQILLITDGCSNAGTDPVRAAKAGCAQGVTTSVIGIVDDGSLGEQGRREAQEIAEAGGGMCRIVRVADLSMTMQMVTRQTMQLTLHQVVNEELRQLVGKETDHLPPDTRTQVARLVDTMAEEAVLHTALVIDVSASMATKMPAVREAVRDMEFGLNARTGSYRLLVFTYPGARGGPADLHEVQNKDSSVADMVGAIRPAGNTPTGPALAAALDHLLHSLRADDSARPTWDESVARPSDGYMRDYVV